MPFFLKLLVTNVVIIACARIGRHSPSLGGLIATMPLTSLLVLLWLAADTPGNTNLFTDYTRGVLWGIVPTILFFLVAHLCFRRELPFAVTLLSAFAVWILGAVAHQWLVK